MLCAQRLLTAETQVTLTLSQPFPTAKSLTPNDTRPVTSPHSRHTSARCQRQACGARTPERTISRRASRFHTPCVSHSHDSRDSRSPPPAPLDISYHTAPCITRRHARATRHATCTPCSRPAAHTLCVRVPPLLRYLKCMHTLHVRVPTLFVSQMYMLKRTSAQSTMYMTMYDTEARGYTACVQALTSACYASSLVPRAVFMMDQHPSLNEAARAGGWTGILTALLYHTERRAAEQACGACEQVQAAGLGRSCAQCS